MHWRGNLTGCPMLLQAHIMHPYTNLAAVFLNPGAIQYSSTMSHMGPSDTCVGPWASCVITGYKTLGRQVLFPFLQILSLALSAPLSLRSSFFFLVACYGKVLSTEKSTPVVGTCKLYKVVSENNMAVALAASSAYLFPLASRVVSRV